MKKIKIKENGSIQTDDFYIICDIDKYLLKFSDDEIKKAVNLSFLSNSPWEALKLLNVDYEKFKKECEYECPFSENVYNVFVPAYLVTEDLDKYKKSFENSLFFNFLKEEENRKSSFRTEPDTVQRSFLGHGYTCYNLPHDGSNDIELLFKIELDNGDFIVGFLNVWYNK